MPFPSGAAFKRPHGFFPRLSTAGLTDSEEKNRRAMFGSLGILYCFRALFFLKTVSMQHFVGFRFVFVLCLFYDEQLTLSNFFA